MTIILLIIAIIIIITTTTKQQSSSFPNTYFYNEIKLGYNSSLVNSAVCKSIIQLFSFLNVGEVIFKTGYLSD